MRLPNGYGTVAKLSGKRRRPYIVKKTLGLNEKGHPIIEIVGYAASREEGLELLAQFNRDPWDVGRAKITLQELSNLWKCESIVKRRKKMTNDAVRMRMTLWKKNSSNYTAPFANAMIADL